MRLGLREKKDLRDMYRRRQLRKIKLATVTLCLVVSAVGFIIWGPLFRLENVVAEGVSRDDNSALASIALDSLKDKPGILPTSLLFDLPEEGAKGEILAMYPEIEDVTFSWRDRHTVVMHIKDRLAAFLWCGESPDEFKKACYYMSPDGVILSEAPVFSGSRYTEFYGPVEFLAETQNTPTGGMFYPEVSFGDLRALLGAIENSVKVANVRAGLGGINFYTKDGWYIKADNDDLIDDVKKRIEVALSTKEVQERKDLGTLEYVDVRYSNKVFFK